MPIYRALGLRTRIRVSNLEGTISSTPQRGRTKDNSAMTKQMERTLASGDIVHEIVTMTFIDDFPMMMVHVDDISQSNNDHFSEGVRRAMQKLEASVSKAAFSTPAAFAIEVNVPKKLFKLDPIRGRNHNDVKVEVFYNGQLAESMIILGRIDQDVTELVSGRRIGLISARPWVWDPEKQSTDGTAHDELRMNVNAAADSRWTKVQYALKLEAELRDVDTAGFPSPSRAYISALADLKFPEDIMKRVRKSNLARFGVIDIVFTLGNGRKGSKTDGLQYLFAPLRVPSGNRKVQRTQNQNTAGASLRPTHSTSRDPVPQLRHHQFDWPTPELSRGSVCSYAESGQGTVPTDPGQRHVFRMVKSMRNAEFVESEMVFAVRYIVG